MKHQLDRIERDIEFNRRLLILSLHMLDDVLSQERNLMATLQDLETQIAANTSAEESAVALIQGLAVQIAANAGSPAKIAELAANLKGSADKLAAAVVANTPAATP